MSDIGAKTSAHNAVPSWTIWRIKFLQNKNVFVWAIQAWTKKSSETWKWNEQWDLILQVNRLCFVLYRFIWSSTYSLCYY